MNTVRLGANRCGTHNFVWKQYNEQFRLKMAENPNANWADVDVELWLLYINPHIVDQSFTSNMIYKCYAFNYNGVCNKQNCTYSHCCMLCFWCSHQIGHLYGGFMIFCPQLKLKKKII